MATRATVFIVLIVFLITLTGCGGTGVTPDSDRDTPGEQVASERSEEKIITTFPEGMEEMGTYRLLDWHELPFTTYVPIGMYEGVEALQEEDAQGVRIGPLEIMFFGSEVDQEQARQAYQELISRKMAGISELSQDELPSWVVASTLGVKGDRYYHAKLGEHQGRYFYMYEEAPIEIGDGWAPVYSVLVEEWRWRDCGARLQ